MSFLAMGAASAGTRPVFQAPEGWRTSDIENGAIVLTAPGVEGRDSGASIPLATPIPMDGWDLRAGFERAIAAAHRQMGQKATGGGAMETARAAGGDGLLLKAVPVVDGQGQTTYRLYAASEV